jgi:hypothetical protein
MTISPRIRLGTTEPVAGGLRAGLTGCAVALCLMGWIAASHPAMAQTPVACSQDPSWGDPPSVPPVDVCGSGQIHAGDFYAFSWRIFKFLVWPALSGSRGDPDATRKITDMHGPRTFETLKADWEIFLPNAARPAAWSDYPSVAGPCHNHPNIEPGALVLASFSKFGNLNEGEPAVSYVLVAQNQTYVRYQAAFDKKVFDKILNGQLYDAGKVGAIPAPAADMSVPEVAKQPEGAFTVKSAWIELPGKKETLAKHIDPSRFYVRHDAWLQDPQTGDCRIASVGLVGLHIVYKTRSRPQWIWSTFEHVDNVPEKLGDRSGRSYTFHNGDFSTHMTDEVEQDFLIPTPTDHPGPGVPPRAYQVERLQQIHPEAMKANLARQKELGSLGSVWQYYKLVMTQWPFAPSAPNLDVRGVGSQPNCGGRNGTATVNTTMETFLQTQQDCKLRRTCMGCHDAARATDFVWSIQLNQYKPPTMPGPEPRAIAIKVLQDLLQTK